MFGKVRGFALVAGVVALGFMGVPKEADAQILYRTPLLIGTPVAVSCMNPGSHQDVAKNPIIKNTSAATIKAGKTIAWKATDGDKGSMKLLADLPVNGTVTVSGVAGNGYTCSASFMSSADLTISSASLGANNQALFTIQNLDPWVDAPPQVVRFEVVECSSNKVLASLDTAEFPMTKMSGKSFSLSISPSSGKRYVRVKADATGKVGEFNEQNNVYASMDSCVY
jgi:hypothetical protein